MEAVPLKVKKALLLPATDDSSEESPPLLSEYVVLDPSFLTQEVMSSLFHPDCAGFLVGGKLPPSNFE